MDQIIAEMQKKASEKLCISPLEYRGHTFVDMRVYFIFVSSKWMEHICNTPQEATPCHTHALIDRLFYCW
jgi:hypothetical protein